MKNYARTENSNKNGFTHYYSDISSSDLSESAHDWFISNGYKLKDGDGGNGTYEKGSRVARLLLGAFYKYFKWQVHTEQSGSDSSIEVAKESSGMSGGVIGMNQVKKELENVSNQLMSL
jgi:hypothetical protein